jgi:radical SAM superfamily enzyme YgiQ (UPF0313 family)
MIKNTYHAVIMSDAPSMSGVRPLGAYAVANSLRQRGYKVFVIDYMSSIPKDVLFSILEKTVSNETLFVGYSSTLFTQPVTTYQAVYAKKVKNMILPIEFSYFDEINNHIKQLNPSTKIVFGGANSKIILDYEIEKGYTHRIDYLIFGNAEQMILDFVENLKHNKPQNTSQTVNGVGIIEYDIKGELFSFNTSMHTWHTDDNILLGEPLPLEVARGCIFKCKFCAYPLLGKSINDDSYIRKEELLLEEILENYDKFQTTDYLLMDDTFNERTDKIELLLRVRDRSKLNLTFAGYNRIDLIHRIPEQVQLLNELNFNGMFFGIETMNHKAAKFIGKGCKPEDITETLYKLKDAFGDKLVTTAGFIIGLPYDTPETVEAWTRTIITPDYPLDNYSFSALALTSNSNSESIFFADKQKYGFEKIDNWLHTWKNDVWDYYSCRELVQKYSLEAFDLNKGIGAFRSISVRRYGYSWEQIRNLKTKDIEGDSTFLQTNHLQYIDRYINSLKNTVFGTDTN